MAARIRKHHQEEIKAKIQASQLVNFLQNHALSESEAKPSQVDAAKFLLNKLISNAPTEVEQKTELSGSVELRPARPKMTRDEWLASLAK